MLYCVNPSESFALQTIQTLQLAMQSMKIEAAPRKGHVMDKAALVRQNEQLSSANSELLKRIRELSMKIRKLGAHSHDEGFSLEEQETQDSIDKLKKQQQYVQSLTSRNGNLLGELAAKDAEIERIKKEKESMRNEKENMAEQMQKLDMQLRDMEEESKRKSESVQKEADKQRSETEMAALARQEQVAERAKMVSEITRLHGLLEQFRGDSQQSSMLSKELKKLRTQLAKAVAGSFVTIGDRTTGLPGRPATAATAGFSLTLDSPQQGAEGLASRATTAQSSLPEIQFNFGGSGDALPPPRALTPQTDSAEQTFTLPSAGSADRSVTVGTPSLRSNRSTPADDSSLSMFTLGARPITLKGTPQQDKPKTPADSQPTLSRTLPAITLPAIKAPPDSVSQEFENDEELGAERSESESYSRPATQQTAPASRQGVTLVVATPASRVSSSPPRTAASESRKATPQPLERYIQLRVSAELQAETTAFLRVYRLQQKTWHLLRTGADCDKSSSPIFPSFVLKVRSLCEDDFARPFRLEIVKNNEKGSETHEEVLGGAEVNIQSIVSVASLAVPVTCLSGKSSDEPNQQLGQPQGNGQTGKESKPGLATRISNMFGRSKRRKKTVDSPNQAVEEEREMSFHIEAVLMARRCVSPLSIFSVCEFPLFIVEIRVFRGPLPARPCTWRRWTHTPCGGRTILIDMILPGSRRALWNSTRNVRPCKVFMEERVPSWSSIVRLPSATGGNWWRGPK